MNDLLSDNDTYINEEEIEKAKEALTKTVEELQPIIHNLVDDLQPIFQNLVDNLIDIINESMETDEYKKLVEDVLKKTSTDQHYNIQDVRNISTYYKEPYKDVKANARSNLR